MKLKNRKIVVFMFVVFFLLIGLQLLADPNPPDSPVPQPPNGAPIDGGLSFLIAAGVAYGSKKLFNKRKQE